MGLGVGSCSHRGLPDLAGAPVQSLSINWMAILELHPYAGVLLSNLLLGQARGLATCLPLGPALVTLWPQRQAAGS